MTASAQALLVSALFPDRRSADTAYRCIVERGYARDEVNLVMAGHGAGLIAIGAIASALSGAGRRDASGGLLGALRGWGFSADAVARFEAGLRAGGVLIAVRPHDRGDAHHFQRQWRALRACEIQTLD